MILRVFAVIGMLLVSSVAAYQNFHLVEHILCDGIIEENEARIPVSASQLGGITEGEFHSTLDQIQNYYQDIVANEGADLVIERLWDDPKVNASASRRGGVYRITMYGGLARHPAINADGFLMVACHEMGHHLGGAPKRRGWLSTWPSNEGQSDYYASLKCLRHVWTHEENLVWLEQSAVDFFAVESCQNNFAGFEDQVQCMRASMAGQNLASVFQQLRNETELPVFTTPSLEVVDRVDDGHPQSQCRLDTYFNGALCNVAKDELISDKDPAVGTCHDYSTPEVARGLRPLCWFAPET